MEERIISGRGLLLHGLTAPWGIAFTTCSLTYLDSSLGWKFWEFWKVWNDHSALSEMSDWGLIVYGIIASSAEVTTRMAYFAIEHIQNRRRKIREERERLLQETLREGRREIADLILTKLEQDPQASSEDIKRAVEIALQETDS